MLGGDTDSLVEGSPITSLVERILETSQPVIQRELTQPAPPTTQKKKKGSRKAAEGANLTSEEVRYLELNFAAINLKHLQVVLRHISVLTV